MPKYDNAMTAHVWANQSAESGQSHNGNLNFSGRVIRSYQTPVASLTDVNGERVALVTSISYSATTSCRHMPAVNRALSGNERIAAIFTVPDVCPTCPADHGKNYKHLVDAYTEEAKRLMRVHSLRPHQREYLEHLAMAANGYARVFADQIGEPVPLSVSADWAEAEARMAKLAEVRNDPAYEAKREKEREARERRKAEADRKANEKRAAELAEARALWLSGERDYVPYHSRADGSAYICAKGDELRTSQGARVPLEDAIRVFRIAQCCRLKKQRFEAQADTSLQAGHFRIDHITAEGTIRAGCHVIAWDEAERVAKELEII